jgi:hypothetical protein
LIIPKGLSEYENRRRTDNIMVIKKPTKWQAINIPQTTAATRLRF